jgi:hypothetical protein
VRLSGESHFGKRARAAAVVGIVGLSCYWAFRLGTASPPPIPPVWHDIDGLSVAISDLNAGTLWEDRSAVVTLPVYNRTDAVIAVRDFVPSCNCISVEPKSITIPAQGKIDLRLKLDLTHRQPSQLGWEKRPFVEEITPLREDVLRSRQGWRLQGIVRSRVTLSAPNLLFGEAPVAGQRQPVRRVTATVHVPAQQLDVAADEKLLRVEVARKAEGRYELTIAPRADLSTGPFQSEIRIDVVTPQGERLSGVTLPVSGQVQSEVRPLPSRLHFGVKTVGDTAEADLVIQMPSDTGIEVKRIEVDSQDVVAEASRPLPSPGSKAIRVTQRVTKPGRQSSSLRIEVVRAGRPPEILTVEVSYHGEEIGPTTPGGGGR